MKYFWTNHAKFKMSYYSLSESRVKRVIKSPLRIEEGIAPNTIAVMQPASYQGYGVNRKWNQEIWVMYVTEKVKNKISDKKTSGSSIGKGSECTIKIISVWRYPGVTKPKDSLPEEIKKEITEALYSI